MTGALLTIKELSVSYGEVRAVTGLSLMIAAGRTAAILGESGSGKSTLLKAIAGLTEPSVKIKGDIVYRGRSLILMGRKERARLMGSEISMIFQNPESFLDPVETIGRQMEEVLLLHGCRTKEEARERSLSLLRSLALPDPERVLASWPFELSGGMCQRVSIAMAAAGMHLKLMLADEPTSALDEVVRAATAGVIRKVCDETGAALLLVTHDVRLAEQLADEIGIMYRGRLVEYGSRQEIITSAAHPYTKSLLRAVPGKNTDFLNYERYRGDGWVTGKIRTITDTHWVLS